MRSRDGLQVRGKWLCPIALAATFNITKKRKLCKERSATVVPISALGLLTPQNRVLLGGFRDQGTVGRVGDFLVFPSRSFVLNP